MIENKYLIPVSFSELLGWVRFERKIKGRTPEEHESSYRSTVGDEKYIPNPRLRFLYQREINIVQLDNAYPALRPRQPARQEALESVG